jgi:exo-beta-1,3-glucanase (GH17 family)
MVGSSSYRAYQPSSQPFYDDQRDVSPVDSEPPPFPPPPGHTMSSPPPPPVHRRPVSGQPDGFSQQPYGSSNYSNLSPPGITPGADNLGEAAAGGGINGIAIGVASSNERESGVQALRNLHGNHSGPFSDSNQYEQPRSNNYLTPGAMPPPGFVSSNSSLRSFPTTGRPSPPQSAYSDSPYNRYSSSNLNLAPSQLGAINPNDADEDDDWGMGPQTTQQQNRRSFVPFSSSRDGSREGLPGTATAAAAGTGAAAGAGAGVLAARDASGNYNAVPGAGPESGNEKSAWLSSQKGGKKKLTWIVSSIIVLVVIGAIVGGILGSTLNNKGNSGSSGRGGSSAQSVQEDNKTDLDKNSDEIKALLNNKDLHKVFPGMDYTPLNAQYPECLTVPPSQNNITRDMAVMGQLTNAVRLYGTDCNQTEMVLHSIDRLGLTDMKVWLGVWLGSNDTTNDRQIEQMWKILDKHGDDPFKGIIIGNEVLFRKDLTKTELLEVISEVKSNLTEKSINLPIACADLGDNWTADMATQVDIVMSNVHPFFAGVKVEEAAAWTMNFWNDHDVSLTAGNDSIKQIIAEVGWPSAGGNDCGPNDCKEKDEGSIAGIDEMNSFMNDWICQRLANGTEYFWFELFDEPWKIRYNTKNENWEDKWGLMDINRNLKTGLTIPDCGGKTISS